MQCYYFILTLKVVQWTLGNSLHPICKQTVKTTCNGSDPADI